MSLWTHRASRIFGNIFICNGLLPVRRQLSPEPILAYRQFDHKNIFHWNLGRNENIFIQEISFKIGVYNMSAIWSCRIMLKKDQQSDIKR